MSHSAVVATHSHVRVVRSFCVLFLTAGVWAGCVLGASRLPEGAAGASIAAGLGAGLTVWMASLMEWAVHRYVYHRNHLPILSAIYRVHHSGHHHIFFPPNRYVANGGVKRFSLDAQGTPRVHDTQWLNALTSFSHFCFYMLLGAALIFAPAWFVTRNAAFFIGMALAAALISYLFIAVHDAIHHRNLHPLIAAQPWFSFLDDHHFIHHVDTEANVNFLLPLGDFLFGTLRRSLTPEELARHGSAESNRARAIGFDEPAKEALARAVEATRQIEIDE